MTPFEQGYKAFLDGISQKENPFNSALSPYYHGRWIKGWNKARASK